MTVAPSRTAFLSRPVVSRAFAAALAAAALLPQPAKAAQTFSVATASEFRAALRAAKVGDTILLAPGDYGNINLDTIRFTDGFVNIRSADPANRARFGQMLLRGASGLAFSGIDAQSSLSPVVSISGKNIRFAGNRIRGANVNGDPWDDSQTGMWVRFASNVVVASNDFQDLRLAMFIQRSTSVAVRHNDFTILREGLNIAASTRGDIDNNRFENFSPNYGAREHPDAIQFWNTNETVGVSHFRIRNNFLSFGHNGNVQGIFLRTENRAIPHTNIQISGNIYYGASYHGISLDAVNDSTITNNIVAGSPWADINNTRYRSADGREGSGFQPTIMLGRGTNVASRRNISTHFAGTNSTAMRTQADDINIYDPHYKRGEPWTNVLPARPTARNPALSEFVTLSPSAAATRGIGILAPFRVGVVTLDPVAAQAFAAAQPLP